MRKLLSLPFIALAGADAVCSDDMDCSLAGECVQGKCVCDGWTHGDHCEVLNLLPVDVDHFGYKNASGWNSWGGGTLKYNDKYYLFVSQMHGQCLLSGHWSKSSEAVRLVSDHPMGPFTFDTVVIPAFAHNVKPYIAPDGTFLVYYIGNVNNDTSNCSEQLFAADTAPLPKAAAGPVMVATAPTVDAAPSEWNHIGPLTDSFEWHSATNPTVVWEDDGTISMWVSRRWDLGDHNNKNNWKMSAATWKGPYHNVTKSYEEAIEAGEDPHVFRTKRGYHMLNHNTGPGSTKLVYSRDGNSWSEATINAFNMTLQWSNGSTTEVCRRQRPFIVMAEDGMPGYLWNGVMDNVSGECDKDPSWTLVQQFGRSRSTHVLV